MARRMFDVMFVLSLLTYRSPSTAKESLSSVLVKLDVLDVHMHMSVGNAGRVGRRELRVGGPGDRERKRRAQKKPHRVPPRMRTAARRCREAR